jgi:hypothetical protein
MTLKVKIVTSEKGMHIKLNFLFLLFRGSVVAIYSFFFSGALKLLIVPDEDK